MSDAYIVAAVRTAGGRRGGRLKDWHPADLAAQALNALVTRTGIDPALVDDVLMGCVGTVGQQAHNVGRGAVLSSILPDTVPATTIDRQCGSSQQALHFAAQAVMSGAQDIVIAAGVESMTRVPMGSAARLAIDAGLGGPQSPTMLKRFEGTEVSQFAGAERMAAMHDLSKAAMDAFAFESHQRAIAATRAGAFDEEIIPVTVETADGPEEHRIDEGIRFDTTLEGIASVKLLREGGRLSAASSSQICDGASGVMVVNARGLKTLGLEPIARVHQMFVCGGDPVIMLDTPLAATQKILQRAGMSIDDIDLYEINEAFASVPMAWLKVLGADPARLNVNGGAIALGHPLGGSGTKLAATLINALKARGKRYGIQAMCEGGGMANATIYERL